MHRLGLDYPTLSSRNPRIIYCSISALARPGHGPGAAPAPILHAASGYDQVNLSHQTGLTTPLNTGIYVGDVLGGTTAFGAIQAALYRRERTGRGDYIDLAMMDAMLGMLIYEFQEAQFSPTRQARSFPPTRTQDGFVMIAFVKPNNFEATAHAIGHQEWITDPRFNTVANRIRNWNELMALVGEWAGAHTSAECEAILDTAGVPCSRYYSVQEAQALPHLAERGSFAAIDDGAGALKVPNPAFKLREGGAHARNYVPALGADSSEILSGILNYSPAQISELRQRKVITAG